jgi:acylphosphatase
MAEKHRAHVIISGRVQGVWFRAATQQAARRYGVSGWVRNQPHGSVEAVLEGEKERLELMLQWCHQGPESARVDRVDVDWQEYKNEFEDFSVRY